MTLDECITILSEHNAWRRGEGKYGDDDFPAQPPYTAKQLGEALDYAVERLKGLEK